MAMSQSNQVLIQATIKMSLNNQELIQGKLVYDNGNIFEGKYNKEYQPVHGVIKLKDHNRKFDGYFKNGNPFFGRWIGGGPINYNKV